MTPRSSAKGAATDAEALGNPAYPALRWRGIAALVVTLVLVLGLALLEYPAYFMLWSEHQWALWTVVVARTLVILALGTVFARRLWREVRSSKAEPAMAPNSADA